jgi:putative ABC transport system substrate-binding protein
VICRHSRRAFISSAAVLAGCFAVVPRGAHAQQPASLRYIGVLLVGNSSESKEAQAFQRGLRDAGYVEGRDVLIEWRAANGDYARVSKLAADLVQRKVDVIVVDSTNAARAALQATSTIPIVMALVADPVGSGLVTNLAHPGANITGLSMMVPDLMTKRLQLLKEAIPPLTRVAVLRNPDTPWHTRVDDLKAAAPFLSIELSVVDARTTEEFDAAFASASRARAEALYVVPDAFFYIHRTTISRLASKARLPAIYGAKDFAVAGGLMSYGANLSDLFRRSAGYVDKILKGAKEGDLPIAQPTKFELIVNLKTANTLGLTIPESVLLQADEVIR